MSVSLSIRHKWHQIRKADTPRETRRAVHEFLVYLDLARFNLRLPRISPREMLINFLQWDATYFLSSADDTLRLTCIASTAT